MSNLFTDGGTVQASGGIYVSREADDKLLSLCNEGSYAYVLTPRQMGKSSLMVETAKRLNKDNVLSVIIDLSILGSSEISKEIWYNGIVDTILEGLQVKDSLEKWWYQKKNIDPTQRLSQLFKILLDEYVKSRVVVFIDEIDTTLDLSFSNDFFAVIRAMFNARASIASFKKLSFVLIGVATPSDLIDDPKRTPFNIGISVELKDFKIDEIKPFIEGIRPFVDSPEVVLEWIYEWTSGHPYLTQKICKEIIEKGKRKWRKSDVGSIVTSIYFDLNKEQENNLQFVRDMLLVRAPEKRSVLIAYREAFLNGIDDLKGSSVISHLKLSGIVKKQEHRLIPRNEIYRSVFNEEWVKSALDSILAEGELTEIIHQAKKNFLQELDLSYRGLKEFPQGVTDLKSLETLNLSGNQIQHLPDSISRLTYLNELNLSNNNILTIPESIKSLRYLSRLYLHDNEALIIPNEVLGPTFEEVESRQLTPTIASDIIYFYFQSLNGRRPLNEAKVILVGHGDVGKTSIVERLVHDHFSHQVKTEGINITKWQVPLKSHDEVDLNMWDFGGQEIMHSTHQFFLSQRSLYLLVVSGRTGHEEADVEYWLRTIESFGGGSPVIVVLNKINEHHFDLNRRALLEKYPFIKGFIETDCKDGTGVDTLREKVKEETDQLPHLRDMFPADWFEIKNKLSNMEENYISFDSFRQICEINGETSKNTQESLARYLHDLGISLNYKEDPRLRHTHVLKPQWVTRGIYAIINAKILAEQRGVFKASDLAGILNPHDYPIERHAFLINLMRKFELCYSYPDEEGKYLLTDLLGKEQPVVASTFYPEECLNFEYRYPIIPEGLIPRFIVRSHVLIKDDLRWKSGVILEFEGNIALVRSDREARKVLINIKGPSARRLLAIIRSDFERIHSSFSFTPEDWVPVPGRPEVSIPYQMLLVYEKRGRRSLETVVGDELVEVDVLSLLSGIDLQTEQEADLIAVKENQSIRLFCSYSYKDEQYREELESHLKILKRKGLISVWHDRSIPPGNDWGTEIDPHLEQADIILLLVSSDYIASDYCYDIEMKRALERHEAGEAWVIPVLIRDVNFNKAPFAKLQALPKDARAVTLWSDRNTAWRNVEEGIRQIIEQVRKE